MLRTVLLGISASTEVLLEGKPSRGFYCQKIKQTSGKVDYQCRATGDAKSQKAARCEMAGAVQPHWLHHACGFALADQGGDAHLIQVYLGHCCIQFTFF